MESKASSEQPGTGRQMQSRRTFLRLASIGAGLAALAGHAPAKEGDRPTPPGSDPSPEQIARHLRRANEVAKRAKQFGHHPFGAILVGPDHETVLGEQGNIDTVNHAEATLVRTMWGNYSAEFLWGCTLYTTFEPCVMCAGTVYWANIGRLVYGAAEQKLLALTGSSHQNPTLDVPCRYVFDHSQKAIKVWGPITGLENELVAPHIGFWK